MATLVSSASVVWMATDPRDHGRFPLTSAALSWLSGTRSPVHHSLRAFLDALDRTGDLLSVASPVSPNLEMTAFARCSLRADGPAIRFDQVPGYGHAVVANLFGSQRRVAQAVGLEDVADLRHAGELLTFFKSPSAPTSLAASSSTPTGPAPEGTSAPAPTTSD